MINLYALLNANAGLQTLIGAGTSPQQARAYPGIAPESAALPLIEFSVVSDTPISTLSGIGDSHREQRQISCHAATYDGANALADAVHAALEGNGYQQYRSDSYSSSTKSFSVFIDWSFLT